MLSLIAPVLFFIPFVTHYVYTYSRYASTNAQGQRLFREAFQRGWVLRAGRWHHKAVACIRATRQGGKRSREEGVSPNVGQWYNCPPGQWVASLHHEDGTPAGMNRCSVSLAEAKALGLRAAFLNNYLTREFANQQEWLGARFEGVKAAAIRTGAGGG